MLHECSSTWFDWLIDGMMIKILFCFEMCRIAIHYAISGVFTDNAKQLVIKNFILQCSLHNGSDFGHVWLDPFGWYSIPVTEQGNISVWLVPWHICVCVCLSLSLSLSPVCSCRWRRRRAVVCSRSGSCWVRWTPSPCPCAFWSSNSSRASRPASRWSARTFSVATGHTVRLCTCSCPTRPSRSRNRPALKDHLNLSCYTEQLLKDLVYPERIFAFPSSSFKWCQLLILT